MLDLLELHKELTKCLNNGEVTLEEAETIYDNAFNEQADALIIDAYQAFTEECIDSNELNDYIDVISEAVKGDKLNKEDKKKIDNELNDLPEKERKEVEDSIKKASKETNTDKARKIAKESGKKPFDVAVLDGVKNRIKKAREKK